MKFLRSPRLLRRRVGATGPLRVLMIVPELDVGGAERHVSTVLPALDPSRFTPSVISIGIPGQLFADVVAGGVPARALGRTKKGMLLACAQLVVAMRRLRPDVVVMWGFNAEMLGRIAALITRVPRTVIWEHNSGGLGERTRLRTIADRVLEPATSAYYAVARGQLPYLTEELRRPAGKIRVIYNGVDPDDYRFDAGAERNPTMASALGIGIDEPVFGTVAVLRPEKDHATLLRAARLVVDEIPTARLLVVGDGPERPALVELAAELGISDHVVFAGVRRDVADLLPVMDVFTLSSRSECFPMALLEAMAGGRPAVCTAVGGVPEMIEEGVTGHLVPVGDPAALAARLVELLRSRELAHRMGSAARARLESQFSLERSVRAAEDAIEQLAGRPARSASAAAEPRRTMEHAVGDVR